MWMDRSIEGWVGGWRCSARVRYLEIRQFAVGSGAIGTGRDRKGEIQRNKTQETAVRGQRRAKADEEGYEEVEERRRKGAGDGISEPGRAGSFVKNLPTEHGPKIWPDRRMAKKIAAQFG
jgi:hypothetical protein